MRSLTPSTSTSSISGISTNVVSDSPEHTQDLSPLEAQTSANTAANTGHSPSGSLDSKTKNDSHPDSFRLGSRDGKPAELKIPTVITPLSSSEDEGDDGSSVHGDYLTASEGPATPARSREADFVDGETKLEQPPHVPGPTSAAPGNSHTTPHGTTNPPSSAAGGLRGLMGKLGL